MAEVHPSAIVYEGTVLGEGVRVLENAVVGKQPSLGASSTAKRDPLPPTTVGDGTVISTGAIVFAGSTVGANCIVGDQSCIRERVRMADDCVLGRGSLIENDTTVGTGTRIQAEAYITAYSTLEEEIGTEAFVGAGAVVTKDVPPRKLVVGSPARVVRDVAEDELRSNGG
jgi:acetyltransferase-like isoleucine patch superfamily enzyme